jgi:hypothetical protein
MAIAALLSEDTAELPRQLILLAGKVDGVVAYARRVEAERDALAARAAEAAQQSARETANLVRWPADGRSTPYAPPSYIRESRFDPEAVARARAQFAEAEARAGVSPDLRPHQTIATRQVSGARREGWGAVARGPPRWRR